MLIICKQTNRCFAKCSWTCSDIILCIHSSQSSEPRAILVCERLSSLRIHHTLLEDLLTQDCFMLHFYFWSVVALTHCTRWAVYLCNLKDLQMATFCFWCFVQQPNSYGIRVVLLKNRLTVSVWNHGQRLKGGLWSSSRWQDYCVTVDPEARLYFLNFPNLKCLETLDLRDNSSRSSRVLWGVFPPHSPPSPVTF